MSGFAKKQGALGRGSDCLKDEKLHALSSSPVHAVSLLPALSSGRVPIPNPPESSLFRGASRNSILPPFLAAGAVMPPRFRERRDRVGFPPPPSPRPATTFAIECTGKKMLEGREKAISVLTEKGFLNGRS